MGVLACSRRGCQNIMCDRYQWPYGYLCEDCFEDLVQLGVKVGPRNVDIDQFMESPSDPSGSTPYEESKAFFEEIFKYNPPDL